MLLLFSFVLMVLSTDPGPGLYLHPGAKIQTSNGDIGEEDDGDFLINYGSTNVAGDLSVTGTLDVDGETQLADITINGRQTDNFLEFNMPGSRENFYPIEISTGVHTKGLISFTLSRATIHGVEDWLGSFDLHVSHVTLSGWGTWDPRISGNYFFKDGCNMVHSVKQGHQASTLWVWVRGDVDRYTFQGHNCWISQVNEDASESLTDPFGIDFVAQTGYTTMSDGMGEGFFSGVADFMISSSGLIFAPAKYAITFYSAQMQKLSGSQDFSSGSRSKVTWDTVDYDHHGSMADLDNEEIDIQLSGIYECWCNMKFTRYTGTFAPVVYMDVVSEGDYWVTNIGTGYNGHQGVSVRDIRYIAAGESVNCQAFGYPGMDSFDPAGNVGYASRFGCRLLSIEAYQY